MWRKTLLVSLLLCLVSMILLGLAVGWPTWQTAEVDGVTWYIGLWQICSGSTDRGACSFLSDDVKTSEEKAVLAVRILICIAMEHLLICVFCLVVHVTCAKSCDMLAYVTIFLSALAGTESLAGVLTYVLTYFVLVQATSFPYGVAFVCANVGAGVSFMASILALAAKRCVNNDVTNVQRF